MNKEEKNPASWDEILCRNIEILHLDFELSHSYAEMIITYLKFISFMLSLLTATVLLIFSLR